jgi:hypothetical protein
MHVRFVLVAALLIGMCTNGVIGQEEASRYKHQLVTPGRSRIATKLG